MKRWWEIEVSDATEENVFLVVEAKIHDPSAWKLAVLERLSVMVSETMREILTLVQRGLTIEREPDDATKVRRAPFSFPLNSEKAANVERLLAQVKIDKKTGEVLPFTNAYRFIACVPEAESSDRAIATACLAQGVWKERRTKKGVVRTHSLSIIPSTTGLQQLLATYAVGALLERLPRSLRAGVCQEVAQQVTSYIGQLETMSDKTEVAFPTIECRDPAERQKAYAEALEVLMGDLEPFAYAKLRDKYPGEFEADDPRGDRLIVDDERWFAVTRTPNPRPIPLLFVHGDAIRPLEATASFDAGISKRNRHRGDMVPNPDVLKSRPVKVQEKGRTGLGQWYAALPILSADDAIIQGAVKSRASHGAGNRGLDLRVRCAPLNGGGAWKRREEDMLVMPSGKGKRGRFERLLRRRDLDIAWTRLVKKRGEWYLQITLRIPIPALRSETTRVLGVSFGIDAIATWVLLENGIEIESGAMAPNPQIALFLERKQEVEGEQKRGRWVGGQSFNRELEVVTHGVVNELVEFAVQKRAVLALEDVNYVQKSGPDHERNVIFTAWNYGQLRRVADYKAVLAGAGEAFFTSDYIVAFTCPDCGAIRGKDQKPDKANTWRENGTLHCRKCGAVRVLTPALRAQRVALHAAEILRERAERKAKKEAAEADDH